MRKYTLIPFEQLSDNPKLPFSEILEAVPKSIRNKVKALLNHIQRNGKCIEWNENGRVTIDGERIENSQIINLIKCCFYPYKDFIPEGLDQFKAALNRINTPHTLIGGGALPITNKRGGIPPPGLPTKKRKQWIWHQM